MTRAVPWCAEAFAVSAQETAWLGRLLRTWVRTWGSKSVQMPLVIALLWVTQVVGERQRRCKSLMNALV